MKEGAQTDSRLARLADVSLAPITAPMRLPPAGERRNLAARHALTKRIREEFVEMPGTCLTIAQACRLFGIPRDVCGRVFDELVRSGQLRVAPDSRYRLHSAA